MTNVIGQISQVLLLPAPQVPSRPVPGQQVSDVASKAEGSTTTQAESVRLATRARVMLGLDGQHQALAAIRHAQSAFPQIGRLLDKMESALVTVLKQYPPFPLESRERMELLNSIAGLRKQIDALTFPPPDEEQVSLIGAGGTSGGAAEFAFRVGSTDQVLHGYPVHSGPEGLDLPVLAQKASLEEVGLALEQVQSAQVRLSGQQSRLDAEVEVILGTPDSEAVTELILLSRQELADTAKAIGSSIPA